MAAPERQVLLKVVVVCALWFQTCLSQPTRDEAIRQELGYAKPRTPSTLAGHPNQTSPQTDRDPAALLRVDDSLSAILSPPVDGGLIGRENEREELHQLPVPPAPDASQSQGTPQEHSPSSDQVDLLQPADRAQPEAGVFNGVYNKENRVVPGLIQSQWMGGGMLNLTCQQVIWPTHLLELCDFDPLYRIVGQRPPQVAELLQLTRHYDSIFSQIRTHASELCADAAVEHICQQQVPRCEQSTVNPDTGVAVWSVAGASSQCYKVHRYCTNPAARQVLERLRICFGGAMITGRYELNTCSPLAQVQRRGPAFRRPSVRSCAAHMSPRVRVPNFQLPLYQNNWEMNQQMVQLQRALASGILPAQCQHALYAFSCAPDQRCAADGRRIIPGRTREQCRAVESCLANSMFQFAMDCDALPGHQRVAELDLRPSGTLPGPGGGSWQSPRNGGSWQNSGIGSSRMENANGRRFFFSCSATLSKRSLPGQFLLSLIVSWLVGVLLSR